MCIPAYFIWLSYNNHFREVLFALSSAPGGPAMLVCSLQWKGREKGRLVTCLILLQHMPALFMTSLALTGHKLCFYDFQMLIFNKQDGKSTEKIMCVYYLVSSYRYETVVFFQLFPFDSQFLFWLLSPHRSLPLVSLVFTFSHLMYNLT